MDYEINKKTIETKLNSNLCEAQKRDGKKLKQFSIIPTEPI